MNFSSSRMGTFARQKSLLCIKHLLESRHIHSVKKPSNKMAADCRFDSHRVVMGTKKNSKASFSKNICTITKLQQR